MRRRDFVQQLGAALALASMASHAQRAPRVFRIGFFGLVAPSKEAPALLEEGFRKGLVEHGLIEGRNLIIERRYGRANAQAEAEIAAEFVGMKVDLIAAGYSTAALAARRATDTIPIVMLRASNPERSGLVASLARPGGNVTGMSDQMGGDAQGRQLQTLKEALPRLSTLAVMWHPGNPGSATGFRDGDLPNAKRMRIKILSIEVRDVGELEQGFATLARQRPDALLVHLALGPFFSRIMEFAARQSLPVVSGDRSWAVGGALMTFGPDTVDMYRRGASHVARILNGAKPGDLPVEQATKFELVVNRRTAKALGVTIPQAVLLRADEVIE